MNDTSCGKRKYVHWLKKSGEHTIVFSSQPTRQPLTNTSWHNYLPTMNWSDQNLNEIMSLFKQVGDLRRGWPKGSFFNSYYNRGVGEGATPFPGLLHCTLDPYLIMLSVKQGGIKYHFWVLSLWYDSTWDWTRDSRSIGEHSTHHTNGPVNNLIYWRWRNNGKKTSKLVLGIKVEDV